MIRYLLIVSALLFAWPAFAQDETPAEERSLFTNFLENQLSAPNRQIRISGIQGVLSSNARIGSITVADNDGVWLRIVNASINWSRSTLLLRQRLQINRLAAERIEFIRQPIPDESLPSPESSGFSVPELPVAINLDELDVPSMTFGEDVFGLGSEIALQGRIALADGALDTAMRIERLDGPGGLLNLTAAYSNQTEVLNLDLGLQEPEDGIVANLLGIEGRPPIELRMAGQGPLSELDVQLTLDTDEERVLAGIARLREQAEGLGFNAELEGRIATLIPPQFRDFFGEQSDLAVQGLAKDEGGIRIDALDLTSAALTLSAQAETEDDNFLSRLSLDATVDAGTGEPIVLPVPGGDTTVRQANLVLAYGVDAGEEWSGNLTVVELDTPELAVARTNVDFGGLARNLDDPANRSITFAIDGVLDGLTTASEEIGQALGEAITLDIAGEWEADAPITLERAGISAEAVDIDLAGEIAELAFNGTMAVVAENIAPFSGLADRDLSGALELRAEGEVRPISGAFDLTIDSSATELRIDDPVADSLLEGVSTITGRVARGETGLVADNLRIGNEQIELLADGTFATGEADFRYELSLADLSLVTDQAEGRIELEGRAVGSEGVIELSTLGSAPSGRLAGKQLTEGQIAFDGTLEGADLNGTLGASAFLDGVRVELASGISLDEATRRLTDLSFVAGGARASGFFTQYVETGLLEGQLEIAAADISTAAALALVEATGALNAQLSLSHFEGVQNAEISGRVENFSADETSLASATFEATIEDLFNVPAIDGALNASGLVAAGIEVATVEATASSSEGETEFDARAELENGAIAATRGMLAPEGEGFRLRLDDASFGRGTVSAQLRSPASLRIEGDVVEIDDLAIDIAGGAVTANGIVADQLDLDVNIRELPLSIANLVRADLGLGGTISGSANLSGPRDRPDVAFDLTGRGIEAAALEQAGLSSIAFDASGTTRTDVVDIQATITSPEGLRATASGAVPLGDGNIALDIGLQAFPLAVLNAVVPDQDLAGNLTGSARVTGALDDPRAQFELSASGIGAAPLREAGIGTLEASAAGSFANETVNLTSASVSGPAGLSASASGTIPLSGGGLSVNLSGQAPLSLANQFLIDRGTQFSGIVEFSGTVAGSLDRPDIGGTISTAGAQIIDPEANVGLNDINVTASLQGETVTLQSASANLAAGGSLSASGTISTNAEAGFPANISVSLNQARYADGDLVVATVSGQLGLQGPLTRDPTLSGNIEVERAEISVPENFGGGATAIDVRHRNPPPAVQETLRRARADDGTPVPTDSRPSVLRLDVTINAPNRIFIRGRGLDAEIGGNVRLTGPVNNIQPVGAFELIRGRLGILGQRITFDEGTVTLIGDLDPFIDFIARSQSGDTVVFITVRGRVSNLDISFSSQPELPEDEVLARLIFNRGISDLSPLQIAQLALAAAELAGGADTNLLGSLRDATGLDDIDLVTDDEGNVAVRAGRYIRDNVYVGVEAGAQGSTRGTINLDITEELRARGAVGTDGDSSLGLFFERDY